MTTPWAKGKPLSDEIQTRLRRLIQRFGDRRVAGMLGISLTSVTRGAAGCGLRNGTVFMIETKLDQVETQAA